MKQRTRLGFLIALVTFLFYVNASLGQDDTTEYTPSDLWQAARSGNVELATMILDRGVSVDAKTNYQATALSFAAERGHLQMVKLLIERGAEVNNRDTFYNATPLSWAQMGSHGEVVDYLKERGAEAGFGRTQTANSSAPAASPDNTESNEEVAAEVFLPSSPESRLADRQVSSENWPQFRGTAARGIADGQDPPIQWDVATGDGVAWKIDIPGLGHSCPSIWGDRIFLTTAISSANNDSIKIGNYGSVNSVDDDSEHEFLVIAIDKHNGEIIWQQTALTTVPRVKRHLKSTHANPTVACDATSLVAFFGTEGLFCYSHDGELKWKQDLGFLDSGWFYDREYQWGFAASPVIFENLVIIQCDIQEDSFIAAYHLETGEPAWRTDRNEIPGWSSPTVYFDGDRPLIATNGTRGIRGYDARTGEEVWSFAADNSEIVTPTPFVSQGKIFVTAGYSPIMPIYAIAVGARGEISLDENELSSEQVVWSHRRGGPYMPSPIAYGDYFYVCNNTGVLTCYHLPTGTEVYKERLKGESSLSFVASPVAADGHLYFVSENGQVIVVKSGPEFEQLAVNQTDMNVLSTPAISGGTIIIRGQKSLMAFD